MKAVIEADSKGRILLPLEIRTRIRSRRFELTLDDEKLILRPLPDFHEVKGKYRQLIRGTIEQLEESAEQLVREGRR